MDTPRAHHAAGEYYSPPLGGGVEAYIWKRTRSFPGSGGFREKNVLRRRKPPGNLLPLAECMLEGISVLYLCLGVLISAV